MFKRYVSYSTFIHCIHKHLNIPHGQCFDPPSVYVLRYVLYTTFIHYICKQQAYVSQPFPSSGQPNLGPEHTPLRRSIWNKVPLSIVLASVIQSEHLMKIWWWLLKFWSLLRYVFGARPLPGEPTRPLPYWNFQQNYNILNKRLWFYNRFISRVNFTNCSQLFASI